MFVRKLTSIRIVRRGVTGAVCQVSDAAPPQADFEAKTMCLRDAEVQPTTTIPKPAQTGRKLFNRGGLRLSAQWQTSCTQADSKRPLRAGATALAFHLQAGEKNAIYPHDHHVFPPTLELRLPASSAFTLPSRLSPSCNFC